MKVLQTIFDFVLSVARLFFRGKGRKREFCPQCGALLRTDCPCRCCRKTTGSGNGGSGSDNDIAPDNGEADECRITEEAGPPAEQTGYTFVSIAGWLLFASAFVSCYIRGM